MYTFSSKLKTFSFILMALGVVGIVFGFLNAPKTIEDVEKLLADSHHGHEVAHVEKIATLAFCSSFVFSCVCYSFFFSYQATLLLTQ